MLKQFLFHDALGVVTCLILLCKPQTLIDLKAFWDVNYLQGGGGSIIRFLSHVMHESMLLKHQCLTSALPSLSSIDSEPLRPMMPLPAGSCSRGVLESGDDFLPMRLAV